MCKFSREANAARTRDAQQYLKQGKYVRHPFLQRDESRLAGGGHIPWIHWYIRHGCFLKQNKRKE
jgi:hypothetical protein